MPPTQLRIYYGAPTLATNADLLIDGPFEPFHTLNHSGRVGDANGDGFEDVALFAYDGSVGAAVLEVFLGGKTPRPNGRRGHPRPSLLGATSSCGDSNGDGFDDVLIVQQGQGYSLYEGASTLPNTVAHTWTNTATKSGLGDFDINADGYADFFVSASTGLSILYAGGALTPTVISDGLSRMGSARYLTFTDNDADGRADFAAGDGSGWIAWLGSDGTTNPRSFSVLSGDSAITLGGYLFR